MASKSAALTVNIVADAAKARLGFAQAEKSAKGLGDTLKGLNKTISPAMLAGGFVAVGAAAWAAAGKFADLAKEAIDLGAATGLTTEQASRWIGVADDAGISAESLTATFGKVAKTLDSGVWEKYGIATRDAGGFARSTNEIILDGLTALGDVTNATERARVGNELFGKSWSNLAPLVGQSREEYEQMLAALSDGQVITDEEAAKAERFRLAQDALNDAMQDVTLAIGEFVASLGPAIEQLSELIGLFNVGLAGALGTDEMPITGAIGDFADVVDASGGTAAAAAGAWNKLWTATENARSTWDRVRGTSPWDSTNKAMKELIDQSPAAARAQLDAMQLWLEGSKRGNESLTELVNKYGITEERLADLEDQYKRSAGAIRQTTADVEAEARAHAEAEAAIRGQLDATLALTNSQLGIRGALRNAQDALDDLAVAEDDARTTKDEYAESVDSAIQSLLGVAAAAADADKAQREAAGTEQTAAQAAQAQIDALEQLRDTLDPNSPLLWWLNGYIDDLNRIPGAITTQVAIESAGFKISPSLREVRAYAGGTAASPAGVALIGEKGPELVDLRAGSRVFPAEATEDLLGMAGRGGDTYNVTLQVPAGANLEYLWRDLQRLARTRGSLPVATTTTVVR